MKITQIAQGVPSPQSPAEGRVGTGPSFEERFKGAVAEVNAKQQSADSAAEQVVSGKMGIHEGMLALQEADIAMKALLQVRNKVISAYNDVMKMQV
ncbi:flagellar hook-basal body complex protein FliE [Desulfoluna spongiiphila]|uniref:Flagellar hook-basal body complex protein FliE n=1 Tax=Desulfoluna spongiiphila TaxID=419481 RepID=A0A1G5IX92_9BACT|nr:flagellar hook-basal body complex protein FliE [Desulfoluna spongiiphila]SCY80692.1 flagellar hook-basal body complex protein FliE [Desulfoluna spongiiphila]VVS93265.1 flagellar hook-basal body complex protein flie [Desulfoluna spongiiphila]